MSALYDADPFGQHQRAQDASRLNNSSPPPPTYDNSHNQMPVSETSIPDSQYQPNGLAPYLTLPHHLSLTWLATPILSLIFVAFRLLISTADAQNASDDAKRDLLASCNAAQKAATVAVNLPRFMAEGINRDIEKTVNASIAVARDTMVFSLTALEAIIEFIIDLYRSTFLCFLELGIRGALAVLIAATQEISDAVTATLNGLRTAIQSDVSAANNVIQGAVTGVNKLIPAFLKVTLSVPQFTVPSLTGLQNVTIPNTFQDALTNLNTSLPTLADIRESLDNLIDVPFQSLRNDINTSFSNMRFDAATLPVPTSQQLTFCADMDTGVIDDLAHDLIKIARIGCLLLLALAGLMTLGNCALQWYRWKMLKLRMSFIRQGWGGDSTISPSQPTTAGGSPTLDLGDRNLMSVFTSVEHPIATTFAAAIAGTFRLSAQKQNNIRFFFNYVCHKPAIACFLIGFFGILSVELQLAAIAPLQRHYSGVVNAQINDYSLSIAKGINDNMLAQSNEYAVNINTQIATLQNTVNEGVFGWVNGTITPLNNTLEAFYTDIQSAVEKVFGGTVLDAPMQEFVKCFIGGKVNALESAFTFVQENFQVDIRQVDPGVLLLSNATVQEAVNPIADAAVGGGANGDGSGGLIQKMVNRYVASLKKERVMFLIFLGLWFFVVLMALAIIFWNSYGRGWVYAWGKARYDRRRRQDAVGDGVITPWTTRAATPQEKLGGDDFAPQSNVEPATPQETQQVERKPSRPIVTYGNVKPSSKKISETTAPSTTRNVIKLDSDSTRASPVADLLAGQKQQARHSRKLTADNRRPIWETLMPDNIPAANSPRRGSRDSVSDKVAHLASTGIIAYDSGLLPRLGTLFGRRIGDDDEEQLISPRRDPARSASYESFGRNSSQFEVMSRSAKVVSGASTPGFQHIAPQPRHVQMNMGDKRKSMAANSQLPPPPSRRKAGMPVISASALDMNKSVFSSSSTVPIHHAFLTSSAAPAPGATQTLKPSLSNRHTRQMSDTALTAQHARQSSSIDPSLVNFTGPVSRKVPVPQLSMIPATPSDSASPRRSANPFATPFDDYYSTAGGGHKRSQSHTSSQFLPPLTPNNPFDNPFAATAI
ncbi:plasma membrane fusion protein prm1 [Tulasnella sp. JGI-2019a]|nr:plasma membrane fusion protein prm1 [Tulasnella sp. JGI-2019a]